MIHPGEVQQAMQQQMGSSARINNNVNIERLPQFQEEWRRVQLQLEQQYLDHLNEYKQELNDRD